MKAITGYLLGFLLLINSSCHKDVKQKVQPVQKTSKKNIQIVKRSIPLQSIDPIKDAVKKNNNFIKLVESFKPENYSIDELIDLTNKDLKLFKQLKARHFKSKLDTAAVKSRLVLTEINLKKLRFLIHKKQIETDTIQKTLNTVVKNLNAVIDKMKIYNTGYDEFEEILTRDSLAQARKDSMPKLDHIQHKKSNLNKINRLKKNIKQLKINKLPIKSKK